MRDMTIFRNRQAPSNKLEILGAASALEEAFKKAHAAARKLRVTLNDLPPADLLSEIGTRNGYITEPIADIHEQMQAFEALFNQMAGTPKVTEVPPCAEA